MVFKWLRVKCFPISTCCFLDLGVLDGKVAQMNVSCMASWASGIHVIVRSRHAGDAKLESEVTYTNILNSCEFCSSGSSNLLRV